MHGALSFDSPGGGDYEYKPNLVMSLVEVCLANTLLIPNYVPAPTRFRELSMEISLYRIIM